jgi:hypothetical protein
MKALSLKQIKDELKHREPLELMEIVLSLSKFKKENKELLTYLLFEADNEDGYIESVKSEITEQFTLINTKNYYFMKKGARKILTNTKKFIRYSKKKETEIALLMHFCTELRDFKPRIVKYLAVNNMYYRQLDMIKKAIAKLHEDLQYEYNLELKELII